jgi:hypothetical protein
VLAVLGAAVIALVVLLAVTFWPEGQRGASGDNPNLTGTSTQPSSAPASLAGFGPTTSTSASPSASAKSSSAARSPSSPAARPTGPVTMTAALVKTRLTYNGPCPPATTAILLTVDFTVSGPTRIEYYWKSDPGWSTDINNLAMTVTRAGTTRANGGFYGGWQTPAGSTITYWVQLVVTKPVAYTSEQVTWSSTCTTVS